MPCRSCSEPVVVVQKSNIDCYCYFISDCSSRRLYTAQDASQVRARNRKPLIKRLRPRSGAGRVKMAWHTWWSQVPRKSPSRDKKATRCAGTKDSLGAAEKPALQWFKCAPAEMEIRSSNCAVRATHVFVSTQLKVNQKSVLESSSLAENLAKNIQNTERSNISIPYLWSNFLIFLALFLRKLV